MAVISTLSNEVNEEQGYPKLMKHKTTGLIVLFSSRKWGKVVFADKEWPVGETSHNWDTHGFEDYNGSVTLQNKKGE